MRQPSPKPLLLFLSVLISGCVTSKSLELPELSDWESRQDILAGVDEFEFAGRIGVHAGDEGFNGQLWWRQDGAVFRARISGPLGVGTVFINGDRGKITVTDRDGVVTELHDAEAELRQMYGWTIPVTSLRFWALGIPDPASPAEIEFGDDGRLSKLYQRNWQVDITQYSEGGGQLLPRRLIAVNNDVKVRLVIDNWVFR
ncbi:MAG: outer membrane lipoprotein LolB [Proteobacteria bacterium]|nr:outer membrane lipoprotein LolB [Pseudomonadota bacterium]